MSAIDELLDENEKVLWRSKPVKKAFILPGLASIPIGLVFLAFFIFWMGGAISAGAPGFFTVFGLLFVLIGLGLIFGPPAWQYLRFRNTEYMITNKRIITQTGAIGLDTRFVDFEKIQEVYVKIGIIDRLFGTGSLYAMTAGFPGFFPQAGFRYGGLYGSRPSLAALKEPYRVQKLLQEAIEKTKNSKNEQ